MFRTLATIAGLFREARSARRGSGGDICFGCPMHGFGPRMVQQNETIIGQLDQLNVGVTQLVNQLTKWMAQG